MLKSEINNTTTTNGRTKNANQGAKKDDSRWKERAQQLSIGGKTKNNYSQVILWSINPINGINITA